jgi:hypothetical protein
MHHSALDSKYDEAVSNFAFNFNLRLYTMVGDGATDLESRAPGGADVFVGYGGVQAGAYTRPLLSTT